MAAFHQIGHDSENMLFEPQLSNFAGAILSPVNYDQRDTNLQVERVREKLKRFTLWFDPQLYVPGSTRGELRKWPYFPSDFATADPSQRSWWDDISRRLVEACKPFAPDAICSPVPLTKDFSNGYYNLCVAIARDLAQRIAATSMKLVQTVVVSGADLLKENRPMEIASVVSRTDAEWIYLLVYNEFASRREYAESLEIENALRLISALRGADLKVMVGYSSSEMVLWKAAGADSVATGKFFNLRRFNRSRFEQPAEGGGQLPYWFEESLMAFIREDDLARLLRDSLIGEPSLSNPVGQQILERQPGEAWQALSWRQYLWWFANCEARIDAGAVTPEQLLVAAEENWAALKDKVLMVEPANAGAWVRPWRAALQAFRR